MVESKAMVMQRDPRNEFAFFVVILGSLFCTTGATCLPKRKLPDFQPTPIFQTPPTIEQLAEVLNRTNGIQSLQSNSVSVRVNNEISLSSNLTWLRPRNFRMTATVAGFKGFDLGSNQDAFWMTMRNGMTPELIYAQHEQFEAQANRRMLPVSPMWLVEALGVIALDPYQMIQGPVTRADGMLEITTKVESPIGIYLRTLVVDPQFAFTKQIFLRDPSGRLVAIAQQSKHEYYASVQTSLPHQIKVQLIPALDPPIELDVTIDSYVVNGMTGAPSSQFTFPNTNGYSVTNLIDLNNGMSSGAAPPQVAPPQPYPRSTYRGVPWEGTLVR
ncbi:MAG: hypothetical protein ACK5OC_08035 [Pirellula sp.]